jgi:site-specific DNA-methyltransferase (adenine-specific)
MSTFELKNIDCLEYIKTMPDNSVDCIITDPPYYSTDLAFDKASRIDFDLWFKECFRVLKDSGNLISFSDFKLAREISLRKEFRYEIIWHKTRSMGFFDANLRPLRNHEYILVFGKEGFKKESTYNPQKTQGEPYGNKGNQTNKHYGELKEHIQIINKDGLRYPVSVQTFSNANYNSAHPTAKPIKACEWLVSTYSDENDIVFDPFMGSGTTGIACMNLKRNFIGTELDSEYFEIAKKRVEKAYYSKNVEIKNDIINLSEYRPRGENQLRFFK